jgi:exodeoxyribonuclease VII small subunit
MTFEKKLKQVENIVHALEGELPLEEALQNYKQGMELIQSLQKELSNAKMQVQVLDSATGELVDLDVDNFLSNGRRAQKP